ncbi:MAG: hypothetical protein ACE5F1_15855, partial [Planctomycetota bacterium]
DLAVILALSLLAGLSLSPHLEARLFADRERDVEERLLRLMSAARDARLLDQWSALMRASTSLPDLQPIRDFAGADSAGLPAFWRDESHAYLLNLHGLVRREGWVLAAHPLESPGARQSFRIAYDGRCPSGTKEAPDAATSALLRKLHALLLDSGLAAALGEIGDSCADVLRVDLPDGKGDSRGELPAIWSDGNYLYRVDPIRESTKGPELLEFYAWPIEREGTGFAAFRATEAEGLQQNRNVVCRYDGRRWSARGGPPAPGAGLIRPGSPRKGGGYTGVDGNRWFPVRN